MARAENRTVDFVQFARATSFPNASLKTRKKNLPLLARAENRTADFVQLARATSFPNASLKTRGKKIYHFCSCGKFHTKISPLQKKSKSCIICFC